MLVNEFQSEQWSKELTTGIQKILNCILTSKVQRVKKRQECQIRILD